MKRTNQQVGSQILIYTNFGIFYNKQRVLTKLVILISSNSSISTYNIFSILVSGSIFKNTNQQVGSLHAPLHALNGNHSSPLKNVALSLLRV